MAGIDAVLDQPETQSKSKKGTQKASSRKRDATEPSNPMSAVGETGFSAPGPQLILFLSDSNVAAMLRRPARSRRASARLAEPPGFGAGHPLQRLLAEESADIEPLFGGDDAAGPRDASVALRPVPEVPSAPEAARAERARAGAAAAGEAEIDLRVAFRVTAPPDRLE
jgi:hypothetical protein